MSQPHTKNGLSPVGDTAPSRGGHRRGLKAFASLLAFGLLLSSSAPAQSALFEAPKFDRKLFDIDSVFIEPGELGEVTDALAALASNFPEDTKVTPDLRARALAIALRLNGVHRSANDALAKLSAGEPTAALPGHDDPASVAKVLWDISEALDVPDATTDDHLLACYMMDIAARIDPDREGGLERFQVLALKGDFKGWSGVVAGTGGSSLPIAQPDPSAGADEGLGGADDPANNPLAAPPGAPDGGGPVLPPADLASKQGIGRMLVLDDLSDPPVGRVAGLQANVIVGDLNTPMKLRFLQEDGTALGDLSAPAAFIPPALASAGIGWPANGGSLTFTVEGNYGSANGEGIALPAALLARSLITGKELVSGLVTVGGLGEDGAALSVKDLLAHLRGVSSAKAPLVAVPAANYPQLLDLAVMGKLKPFLEHQIFTVEDLSAGTAIALEQSDDLKRARLYFVEVQGLIATMPADELAANTRVRKRLDRILQLAPNHASTKILLAAGGGSLPAKLSPEGVVFALQQAALPVLKVMQGGGEPVVADLSVFGGTKSSLSGLRSKLDRPGAALSDALVELIGKIEAYSRLNNRSSGRGPAMREDILTTWKRVSTDYGALRGGAAATTSGTQPTGGGGNAG